MLFFILDLTTTSQCLSLVILIEKPSATWLHLVKREVRKTPVILSLLPSMLLLFCSIANCVQQCVTPQTASGQAPSFLQFMSVEARMPSNHLILCCLYHLQIFLHFLRLSFCFANGFPNCAKAFKFNQKKR